MKKQFLTISLAMFGALAVSCGGPSTPRVEASISYDKVPPGERVTANIDGQHFDIDVFRDDVMLNHDEHGTSLMHHTRPTTDISDTLKTTDKDRATFR